MAKVHYEGGRFGLAACGKRNVDTDADFRNVTCTSCELTWAWGEAFDEATAKEQKRAERAAKRAAKKVAPISPKGIQDPLPFTKPKGKPGAKVYGDYERVDDGMGPG
jgi:hypothetical protein